jgi:hypothetical protein
VVTAKTGHFAFSTGRSLFQRKMLRQDRFRATLATSVDLEHPPLGPAFVLL